MLLAVSLGRLDAQTPILVAQDGSGDVTTIQAAVDLAVEGQVILIADAGVDAPYAPFVVDGKSVSLFGVGGRPLVGFRDSGDAEITGLAVGQAVVLANCEWLHAPLNVHDNEGAVFLQDLDYAATLVPGPTSIVIRKSDAVLVESLGHVEGGWGVPFYSGKITIEDSVVGLWNTTLDDLGHGPGQHGQDALWIEAAFLFCSNSLVMGGAGVDQEPFGFSAGRGGHAVTVHGPAIPDLIRLGSTFAGGVGGVGIGTSDVDGPDGEPISGGSYNLVDLPLQGRVLQAPRLRSKGGSSALTLIGLPGDRVWLSADSELRPLRQASLNGINASFPTEELVFVGVVPPSGVLQVDSPFGSPAHPGEAQTLVLQALFVSQTGDFVLSNPRAQVQLPGRGTGRLLVR